MCRPVQSRVSVECRLNYMRERSEQGEGRGVGGEGVEVLDSKRCSSLEVCELLVMSLKPLVDDGIV